MRVGATLGQLSEVLASLDGDVLHVLLDAPLHTYRARILPLLDSGEVEEVAE